MLRIENRELKQSTPDSGNLSCSKCPATYPLDATGLCSELYAAVCAPSFSHKKGYACPSRKTEDTFIPHTVQSNIARKTIMINILLHPFGMLLQTWHII